MLIFIISVIVVSIISLCFFKARFWENRYLILLIAGGVALIATLTTNFFVRGHLEKRIETIWSKPLYTFYMPDSVYFKDGFQHMDSLCPEQVKFKFITNYRWYAKHQANEFDRDTTIKQTPVSFVLFADDKKGKNRYVGVFKSQYKQNCYDYDLVYLAPSSSDTLIYVVKRKLVYSVPPSNWITGFSFPRVKTATVIYLPPREYAFIPDSLIHKIPF
jgi:hypothetical protein